MLMAEPEVVAQAVRAMRSATSLPVTVKHQIGIDDYERYEDMLNFLLIVLLTPELSVSPFTLESHA